MNCHDTNYKIFKSSEETYLLQYKIVIVLLFNLPRL